MDIIILWNFVYQKLDNGIKVALMMVPESHGSSPGKQGHIMALASDDTMIGTIGGGAMEYIQVEACKKLLIKGNNEVTCKKLVHDQASKHAWSGLSCSGEQILITYFLNASDHFSIIKSIIDNYNSEKDYCCVFSSENQFFLTTDNTPEKGYQYKFNNQNEWEYRFLLDVREKVYLIGAGHVGLALCRQLFLLNFNVILIDNRKNLSTEEYDKYISKKIVTNYKNVSAFVPSTHKDFIIIMSFSRALDILILSQLIDKPSKYMGLMASMKKAEVIKKVIVEKGFTFSQIDRVYTPIGIPIKCKSPEEIAVSVAAQMIEIRNQ
ncbi:MAG: XdhC family protein [Saprospiraceae bacterium]|nr:XdhC family protein [Saprospiraceae bacterium]